MRNRTPEYNSWRNMKKRCYLKSHHNYPNYGARGIIVCNRWKDNFDMFLQDMGPKPTPEHTLDRINPNGNYEPSNCRWATPMEQARTKRNAINIQPGQTYGKYTVIEEAEKKLTPSGKKDRMMKCVTADGEEKILALAYLTRLNK
jgi:hypothetical protein